MTESNLELNLKKQIQRLELQLDQMQIEMDKTRLKNEKYKIRLAYSAICKSLSELYKNLTSIEIAKVNAENAKNASENNNVVFKGSTFELLQILKDNDSESDEVEQVEPVQDENIELESEIENIKLDKNKNANYIVDLYGID